MSEQVTHEDLLGFALGALDDAEQATVAARLADSDTAESDASELQAVRAHLALHDALPALQPLPPLWRCIESRIRAEDEVPATAPTPFLRRFWMPAAAAALIAAAFLWPQGTVPGASRGGHPEAEILHGNVTNSDGSYTSTNVARLDLGDGVVLTMDSTTSVSFPAPQRLALGAGRVFLEVAPGRRGYTVDAGSFTVETTGTAFSVSRVGTVVVETGSVRCTVSGDGSGAGVTVEAGHSWSPGSGVSPATQPRAWFTCPTLEVTVLTPDTIRVVIRNDMPDPISLAPPTDGEPLFFASTGGHTMPLTPASADALVAGTVQLTPGEVRTLDMRLPRKLADGEGLRVTYPRGAISVEVQR